MTFFEDQNVRARMQGHGLLLGFAMRVAKGLAAAQRRHRAERELGRLDDHLLRDVGLERGPDGHFTRRPR